MWHQPAFGDPERTGRSLGQWYDNSRTTQVKEASTKLLKVGVRSLFDEREVDSPVTGEGRYEGEGTLIP